MKRLVSMRLDEKLSELIETEKCERGGTTSSVISGALWHLRMQRAQRDAIDEQIKEVNDADLEACRRLLKLKERLRDELFELEKKTMELEDYYAKKNQEERQRRLDETLGHAMGYDDEDDGVPKMQT